MRRAILFIAVVLLFVAGCGPAKNYDDFAKCLANNNVTMFGAYWCPHCNAVKTEFGDSFKYMHYVECDENGPNGNPDLCQKAGVQYYPTFFFKDGSNLFGEVSFDILSEKSGCALP